MFEVGDIIEVVVTGTSDYGIFVKANNDFNGLIHISEISNLFVKNPRDYVRIDEHILSEVKEVDNTLKRLKLSIKDINYKLIPRYGKIRDENYGFKILQMNLPKWIKKKALELEKE